MMAFKKGGRRTATETITCEGVALTAVNRFKYLGITFQPTGTTFTLHVKERMAAAALAINDFQHLSKLSLQTAMTLFRVKVKVISYGLHLTWEHLSASNLQCIEKIKSAYLMRVLWLSKYTRSRLVYEMCRELS